MTKPSTECWKMEKLQLEHKTERKCNTVCKKECHPVQKLLQKTHYEDQCKDLLDEHCTTVYENKCNTKQERECTVFYETSTDSAPPSMTLSATQGLPGPVARCTTRSARR